MYAPTFRANLGSTFTRAIPDFERLHQVCREKNILLIFKVHPNIEREVGFLRAWESYGEYSHFLFWNNQEDFYEVMHQMDLAIVDYSSILSDMVAMGVPHYIRYAFDLDEYLKTAGVHDNYFEVTTGRLCRDFDAFLDAIRGYDREEESAEIQRLNQLLWSYSRGKEDFDQIVECALHFRPEKRSYPNLYSFDVFDTLISRKVLEPAGIFYAVQEKIARQGGFPYQFTRRYPQIRAAAAQNVREYYAKSCALRHSERVEIRFDEIFDRLAAVYDLEEEQIACLKRWELEAEEDNVQPIPEQIQLLKELVARGETVVLISDMYLPEAVVRRLLEKADPALGRLPLFLSSEYGVLKTSQRLFFEVYKSFQPYYNFEKWIHYGDDPNADIRQARGFKIQVRPIPRVRFRGIQSDMTRHLGTYDAYLVAAMQARLCARHLCNWDDFVLSFVGLGLVPYVDWVLRHAQKQGYETLYFISRDGHHLKRIADAILQERQLSIKTKYIYASRKTWWVPSYIREVDEGFYSDYGVFNNVASKEKLLDAMELEEAQFRSFFPHVDPDKINYLDKEEIEGLVQIFKNSAPYNAYLLERARESRELVSAYLRQEIDPEERFAFVEYYGRGYTQDRFLCLWQEITGREEDVPFYYSRSTLPSLGHAIRYHYTTETSRPLFMEAIFANMPYKSVRDYQWQEGEIRPVLLPSSYDPELFASMEELLPELARAYVGLGLQHPEDTGRMLHDFVYDYYRDNLQNPELAERIGSLKDAVAVYGSRREYAPAYTEERLRQFQKRELPRDTMKVTSSVPMSLTRSSEPVQKQYRSMYQILPGDPVDSGRLLSEREQQENQMYEERYRDLSARAQAFREAYEKAAACPVEDLILILSDSRSLSHHALLLLQAALKEQNRFRVKTVLLKSGNWKNPELLAAQLARARYLLVTEPIGLLCKTRLRPETREILLPNTPFQLYNNGLASTAFLKWRQRYDSMRSVNDIAAIQIPAPAREPEFRRLFSNSHKTDCSLLGSCVTDVFFSDSFRRQAAEKLYRVFPASKGRKLLLYMPTLRYRQDCESWAKLLDLELLQERLGGEYAVLLSFNADQRSRLALSNQMGDASFCKEMRGELSPREMMVLADVIVGDYRDSFFESAILRKPVFSTAFDYERMIQAPSMSMNACAFSSYLFAPVVSTVEQLVDRLQHLDAYDYTPMEAFRQRMFSACDGHSVERVVDYLLAEAES